MRPYHRFIVSENPHQPAEMHLPGGRSLLVRGFDYVFFPPRSRTIVVAVPVGGFAIVDCGTVSEVRTRTESGN